MKLSIKQHTLQQIWVPTIIYGLGLGFVENLNGPKPKEIKVET